MSKDKNIPELRFPEFKNEGEWEEKVVSQLAEYENGKAHEQDINEEGKYIVVNSKFISTDGEVRKYTNSANCIAQKDDILMVLSDVPNGRAIAKCYIVDKNNFYTVNQRICKLTPTNADSKILYYLLNRNAYFLNFDDGVKQTNLRNEDVLNCPLVLPKNPKEQQKIASCLSSLDEVIATHSQKLDVLKNHKKGLMQNLFPQEGEKLPKYRFKEFENDGEWVEQKLNYYLELLTDFEANGSFADVKANVNVFDEPNYAWYVRATDLEKKSNSDSVKYVDEHSYNFLNKTKLLGGELLITKRGEIGKVYMYEPTKELPATVAPNLYLLKLNEKANPKFFYYHFTNTIGNQSLKRLNASSTIGALYKDDVKNINVFVPSIKEQKKIASCLSSLDALITAQAEKIEQLKLHKKGLMQGLFPKIND